MAEKGKEFPLSIVLRAVDRATSVIKRVNDGLEKSLSPYTKIGKELGALSGHLGIGKVGSALAGVGTAVKDLAIKFGVFAGVAAAALYHVIDSLDNLGDTAERIGITADALAGLRYAAERTGSSAEVMDAAFGSFSKNLGQAKAGTGKLAGFLSKVSPELLKQVKAAKSTEEAFGLIADATAKLTDQNKKAALATAAFGGSGAELVPLLSKGSAGVAALTERYRTLAGPQQGAADAASDVKDSLQDAGASFDGVKAAIVEGLGPVLTDLFTKLSNWIAEHRADISKWIKDFGDKLPARIKALSQKFDDLITKIKPVWDALGGMKGAAIALAAVLSANLITAFVKLGAVMLTTPFGLILAGVAGLISIGWQFYENWGLVADFFGEIWDKIKAAFWGFLSWVWDNFLSWTPLGLIIENWQPIQDFFVGMWDAVVAVFEAAWKKISAIVDKVTGAAKSVWRFTKRIGGAVGDFVGGGGGGVDLPTRPNIVPSGIQAKSGEARVMVDFANAPKGTRVTADPMSTADVDLSVGYQMSLAP